MNLGEFVKYVQYLLNRDQVGVSPGPDEINILVKTIGYEFFEHELDKFFALKDAKDRAGFVDVLRKTPLKRYIYVHSVNPGASGFVNYPERYRTWLGLRAEYGKMKDVEVLDPSEVITRLSYVSKDPYERPFASELKDGLQLYPFAYYGSLIPVAHLTCLTNPQEAVFDYYYYNGRWHYFEPGYSIHSDILYDSSGVAVKTGVTHDNGNVTSASVELDFDEAEKPKLAEYLVQKIARNSKDQGEVQISEMKQK